MVGTTAEDIYDPLVHISPPGRVQRERLQMKINRLSQPWLVTGGYHLQEFYWYSMVNKSYDPDISSSYKNQVPLL